MSDFLIRSNEFQDGQFLPDHFQADHALAASPQLSWENAPEQTKSFAIAMHDPDAPTGGAGWWHWMAINIPADCQELPHNAGQLGNGHLPAGARQLRNDGGDYAYGGCYPPEGDPAHRYHFTVYALDCEIIDLPQDVTTSMTGFMVNAHCIGQATITGLYQR